jgi:hypothetical protein
MKKTLIALSILLVTSTQAFSYTSLIDNDPAGFDVVDMHVGTDTLNPTYKGYSSTLSSGADYYTGYYLGTVIWDPNKPNQNDSVTDLTALMNAYLGQSQSYTFVYADDTTSNGLAVTFSDSSHYAGTWSTEGSTPPVGVQFYSIKGSNSYALYFVDPSVQKGSWTSAHLVSSGQGTATFSHMTASTSPVPVPSTALLLGSSLLGLVGFNSRRRRD